MNQKLLRLVLAAVLFAAWMGYLSYLVYALPRSPNNLPIVLSRPQILVSDLDVVGSVDVKEKTVKVQEVLFARGDKKPEPRDELKVTNLDDIKPPLAEQANLGPCLLPLQTFDEGQTYRVVRVPPSPGFSHGDPRIYPATAETLAEYRSIQKP